MRFWKRQPRNVTYNITVNSPFADGNTGKKIVELIKQYERASGSSWRRPDDPPSGVAR